MTQKNLTDNVQDLPKWAQSEVRVLQMRLREAKEELTRLNDNPESNTINGNDYAFQGEQTKYLKNNQEITFLLKNGKISARIKNDCIYIMAHTNFKTSLCIKPSASNTVEAHII